jgi:hypothetical protein
LVFPIPCCYLKIFNARVFIILKFLPAEVSLIQ